MKERLTDILITALRDAKSSGRLGCDELPAVNLERPKDPSMGDWASTVPFALAPSLKLPPRQIAATIVEFIGSGHDILEKVELAGAGYINFYLAHDVWCDVLREIEQEGDNFGRSNIGEGKRTNVEFVSANPTGPMHIGHGRGAAVGDALCRLLNFSGYDVIREFYINDAGRQMKMMGLSVYTRYRQLLGDDIPFIEDGYGGDYVKEVAQKAIAEVGDRYRNVPTEQCLDFFTTFGYRILLDALKKDLSDFGVEFDIWFSERGLYERNEIEKALTTLREKGFLYEDEDALWLKSTAFGDDK
ncbi:MAG: arginine--tRNA ligase, partial [Nitrospirota bacterium]|nr:arginine--tRNA ligase [Nitrospirota bacterium]